MESFLLNDMCPYCDIKNKIKKRVKNNEYDEVKKFLEEEYIIIYSHIDKEFTNIFAVHKDQYKNEKVTFVIQGKRNTNFNSILDKCFEYGLFIDSTWDDTDDEFIKVKNEIQENNYSNLGNIYFQTYSTLKGIYKVETEYIIKCRGDEYYNYNNFIHKMLKNPHKIITNNVYAAKTEEVPFHPSDHLIGGKTENLKLMFEKSIELLKKNYKISNEASKSEQHLAMSYLCSSKNLCDFENLKKLPHEEVKKIMKDNFEIVNINDLKDYEISHMNNTLFKNIGDFHVKSIDDI